MSDPIVLTLDMADEISDIVELRQEHFDSEPLDVSVKVVVLNYDGGRTQVACIAGEWQGTKGDVRSWHQGDEVPHCPNGHVLTQSSTLWRLALVEVADEAT